MMLIRGQVQTVENGTNVLVDTTSSSNRHWHYSNKRVNVVRVLSDEEIIDSYLSATTKEEQLARAKKWISKKPKYAISQCHDVDNKIQYQSIVEFED